MEEVVFEAKKGEPVIKDLQSGNVFKNTQEYFDTHYKVIED